MCVCVGGGGGGEAGLLGKKRKSEEDYPIYMDHEKHFSER